MAERRPPVNIGILAHVDGGKTTLTEQLLFRTGAIRQAGRVDEGSAHTDFMEIERRRGISVRAASAFCTWKGREVNIIDTPGHSDFSGEVQRALRALDFAVLVISAVDGVQAQTELLWKALAAMSIPVLFFINKTDRTGADAAAALRSVKETLGAAAADAAEQTSLLEAVCETDDALLERYLDKGAADFSALETETAFRKAFYERKIFPALSGSALKGEGVEELLDLISLLGPDEDRSDGELSGVIFKLEHDAALGRVAHVRLYSGRLRNRDAVTGADGVQDKVVQIRRVQGSRETDVGELSAGEIGAVYGLSRAKNGGVIGSAALAPKEYILAAPMLRVRLTPADENDYPALAAALVQLADEDPLLDVIWQPESRELLVCVSGRIQTEVLLSLLSERFSLAAEAGEPQVIYRERPLRAGEGYVEYTMPKPCWAVLRFAIEPLPLGSGVVFKSIVPNDKIYLRYQAQVEQTIPEALRQGPKGWEVTDLKITLIGGEHHIQHTHPLDFALATPMGIMDGLVNTGTELLEPVQKFRLSFPEEFSGKMIGEIMAMRGSFDSPLIRGGTALMEGRLPVAASLDFPARLASLTGGRGAFSAAFDGCEPCPPGEGRETPYRGVSPLDRAKYILSKRGALS